MRFTGIQRVDGPDDMDAGAGRRIWLAERIGPTDAVIDLGGTGNMLDFHPVELVTAFDDLSGFGPGHVIRASRFVEGDVAKPLRMFEKDDFDVAVLCEVIEHVGMPSWAIRNAAHAARRLLITTPCEQRWSNQIALNVSGHIRFSTPEMFCGQLMRAGVDGTYGLLEFGTWSFLVADVKRVGE